MQLRESVRHKQVFVIQPTAPPVNDHLVELLAFADGCRRAAATSVTAIVPYFAYARQDKRVARREPITASMVAQLMQSVGINHVVVVDPHTPQIEGFFQAPVDSLTAVPTLAGVLRERLLPHTVVVAPDAGRVPMATNYALRLDTPVAVLHKRREDSTSTAVTHLVGEVAGRPCLLVDDLISTGGTIRQSVEALLAAGALPRIRVVATHGLLVGPARQVLDHPAIEEILVTDTVIVDRASWPRLEVASLAPLIAGAIERLMDDRSLADLF